MRLHSLWSSRLVMAARCRTAAPWTGGWPSRTECHHQLSIRSPDMRNHHSTSEAVMFVRRCLGVAALFAAYGAGAQVVPFSHRSLFASAGTTATNIINFENHSGEEGFLPDFTELRFVTFHTNVNYGQEVIDGSNLGQPGNKVYLTVAADLTKTIADITFGKRVLAVGFDLKDSGNNATTGSQGFLATLF